MSKKEQEEKKEELSIERPDETLAPKFGTEIKIAVLNGPIVTSFGNYTYFPIPIESAKILINAAEFSSFVGHESTSQMISKLLEKPIGYSRKELKQKIGQIALVFRLKQRAPEGKVLSKQELEEIGYEFGILYRLK